MPGKRPITPADGAMIDQLLAGAGAELDTLVAGLLKRQAAAGRDQALADFAAYLTRDSYEQGHLAALLLTAIVRLAGERPPMAGSKPRPWRPSATQRNALRALEAMAGRIVADAARVGAYTAQSPDGAAATLASLVRRGLVAAGGHGVGEPSQGYRLTGAGRAALEEARHAR